MTDRKELANRIQYALDTEGRVVLFKESGEVVVSALRSDAQARQASPQEVQEACAQVADRAQARDAEDYTAALKDEALSHTGREAILERLDASRSRARDIGISIRALIPSSVPSTPSVAQGWQESAAKWLEARSDLLTNSLHCGDSSMAIHFTHKHATALRSLAKDIRDSTVSSTHQRCAKCGCETKGEAALVDGKIWCHPCADMAPSTPPQTLPSEMLYTPEEAEPHIEGAVVTSTQEKTP